VGSQYRSGIWYASDRQRREAESYIRELESKGRFAGRKIVTQVEPAKTFYPAEEYHQDYIEKTGGTCHVTNPWEP
jgi:peptide methionine sulfoxide reductase MsrA